MRLTKRPGSTFHPYTCERIPVTTPSGTLAQPVLVPGAHRRHRAWRPIHPDHRMYFSGWNPLARSLPGPRPSWPAGSGRLPPRSSPLPSPRTRGKSGRLPRQPSGCSGRPLRVPCQGVGAFDSLRSCLVSSWAWCMSSVPISWRRSGVKRDSMPVRLSAQAGWAA